MYGAIIEDIAGSIAWTYYRLGQGFQENEDRIRLEGQDPQGPNLIARPTPWFTIQP